jgi:hypothetical protein
MSSVSRERATSSPGTAQSGESSCLRLRLNHPKNYVGVPVAIAAPGDTGSLVMGNLTAMAGAAKLGARAFGLIDTDGEVTDWGWELLKEILGQTHPDTYLEELRDLQNSRGRFIEQRPEWDGVGEAVARRYDGTEPVIEILQQSGPITLPELVSRLAEDNWGIASRLFLKDTVADSADGLTDDLLEDSESYRGAGVCQFKGVLYHFGVVTMPGSSTDYLDPGTELWELEPHIDDGRGI